MQNNTSEFYFLIILILIISFIFLGILGIIMINDINNLKDFIEKREKNMDFKKRLNVFDYIKLLNYGHMILMNKSLRKKINERKY